MDKVFATQASGPGTRVKVECGSGERWERGGSLDGDGQFSERSCLRKQGGE